MTDLLRENDRTHLVKQLTKRCQLHARAADNGIGARHGPLYQRLYQRVLDHMFIFFYRSPAAVIHVSVRGWLPLVAKQFGSRLGVLVGHPHE